MNVLGLLLVLINVGAIAGPVAGVVVVHYNNPVEMVIPPAIEEVATAANNSNKVVELPQYVSSTYDVESKTVTATFSFTNPFEVDMRVDSVSADVKCAAHVFALGRAELSSPVEVKEGATAMITIVFTWTQPAESHFLAEHPDAGSIDIHLVNVNIDVSGIDIETPESISLTVPLT